MDEFSLGHVERGSSIEENVGNMYEKISNMDEKSQHGRKIQQWREIWGNNHTNRNTINKKCNEINRKPNEKNHQQIQTNRRKNIRNRVRQRLLYLNNSKEKITITTMSVIMR